MRYLLSLLVVCLLFLVAVPSIAYSPVSHRPQIKIKQGLSTNWAGYAALTSLSSPQQDAVSDVKGSWKVPSLDCSGTTGNTYSSAWVGIDGYSSSSVEQTGTEHDCINGQAQYSAWYEMYPKPSYRVSLPVRAGDIMNARVQYTGNGKFVLTLANTTTGNSFTTTQRSNKASRSSAEWIVEAPWSGGVLPLANFQTIGLNGSQTTINNITNGIGSFANDRIDMVASDGTTLKASTSALSSGTDFSVTWLHQ